MENYLVVSYSSHISYNSVIYLAKRNENTYAPKTCIRMLKSTLLIIESTGNNPYTHPQMNAKKYWYIYTWKYYFIMQKQLICKKARLTTKKYMIKISKTEKSKYIYLEVWCFQAIK